MLKLAVTVIQTHNVSASWLPLEPCAAIFSTGLEEGSLLAEPEALAEALLSILLSPSER